MVKTVCVFNCLSKFAQGPLFLTFEQSFMFLQLKKTLHDFFSSNLAKLDLDLDPHSEKLLDPDPDPLKVANECGSTALQTAVHGSACKTMCKQPEIDLLNRKIRGQ